jgi:hypothetical protein
MTDSINIQSDDTITITSSTGDSYLWNSMTSPSYTITTGAQGSSSNLTWLSDTYSVTSNLSGDTLQVKGDASFEGDLKVQGKSIVDSLDRIEDRLAILRPNEELEEKWEQLRGLRKAYMELEQEIIEKEKVWSILKK